MYRARQLLGAGAITALILAAVGVPGAAATPAAAQPDEHAHPRADCAAADPNPPSDEQLRANSCRTMDAGGYQEDRQYMLSGDEGTNETEVSEAANSTWLSNHCAATLSDTTREYYTVASLAFADDPNKTADDLTSTQKDGFRDKIRQELKGGDRVIHQSGGTGDGFHRRVACSKNSAGAYDRIAVRFFNIYSDRTGDGRVSCADVTHYIKNTSPYNNPKVRHMVYIHTSIDGPSNDYCNYMTGDTPFSSQPGLSNPANSTWSVALSENWEKEGIGGYSVAITNQELGHTHALIANSECTSTDKTKCAPGVEAGNKAHTYDWPDFMNGGGGAYYYQPGYIPPLGYRPQVNCETQSKSVFGTTSDLWTGGYVDCGRDTYWNPNPGVGTWLCTHYNYATDSPYFNKKYSRSTSCPA